MRLVSLLSVGGLAAMVAACGQKGPLVLPDAQHPHKKIGLPRPAAPQSSTPQTVAPQPGTPAPTSPGGASPSATNPANGGAPGDAQTAPAPRQ